MAHQQQQKQPLCDSFHAIPNYRPITLHRPFLAVLALYLGCLIGVLEYGCRTFPSSHTSDTSFPVPSDRAPSRHTTVLVSAPLVGPRQTPSPQVPAVALGRPRSPIVPRDSRNPPSVNGTVAHQTSSTQSSSVDLSHITPVSFAGRKAYPPESFSIFQKPEIIPDALNDTKWLNQSTDRPSSLTRRHPDPSNYGRLSGPTVKVLYMIAWDDLGAISDIMWMGPGVFPDFDCSSEGMDTLLEITQSQGFYMAVGVVTCDGPAMVFHLAKCWASWIYASGLEKSMRAAGLPIVVRDERILTDKGTTGVDLATGQMCKAQSGASSGPQEGAVHDGDLKGNSETVITLRDSQGTPEATITADIINRVDSSGSITPIATMIPSSRGSLPGFTALTITNEGTITTTTARLTTLTNARGLPTATVALVPLKNADGATTGVSTRTITAAATIALTLRDSHGLPTATISVRPPPPDKLTYFTLTDPNGKPFGTLTRTYPILPSPTEQGGVRSSLPTVDDNFHPISSTEYGLVLFLPVLLAIVCCTLIQSIHSDLQALLPFRSLTTPGGATSADSLAMLTGGIPGIANSLRLLFRQHEPLSALSHCLVLLAALATSLSSEAVGIKLHGNCTAVDFRGCYMGVAVFLGPSRAVQGLLAVALVVIVVMCIALQGWRTGVAANPLGILSTCSMIQDRELRALVQRIRCQGDCYAEISNREIIRQLEGYRFSFSYYQGAGLGRHERLQGYGIVAFGHMLNRQLSTHEERPYTTKASRMSVRPSTQTRRKKLPWSNYRRTRERLIDCVGLLMLWGLIILITYYNTTQYPESSFERFMNNQNFGVRTLFTGLGVLVTLLWNHFFSRCATFEPYRQLSRYPQPPHRWIAMSTATSAFPGFTTSIARGHVWMATVAFTAILSKFTPFLLSTIPFSPIQTWSMHVICAWTTVGCLAFMSLVIVFNIVFIKYPYMPVDVTTLAGRIYYLCDSRVVEDFEGMSVLDGGHGRTRMDTGRSYKFGKMVGESGEVRIGVERAEKPGEESEIE